MQLQHSHGLQCFEQPVQQMLSCSPSTSIQKTKGILSGGAHHPCGTRPRIAMPSSIDQIFVIVVERTRSGKERKWHLSSRKKARLDAGAMACQHEPSAAESSRRPRAEDAMPKVCGCGEPAVGWGVRERDSFDDTFAAFASNGHGAPPQARMPTPSESIIRYKLLQCVTALTAV